MHRNLFPQTPLLSFFKDDIGLFVVSKEQSICVALFQVNL